MIDQIELHKRYFEEELNRLRVDYEKKTKPLIEALVQIEYVKTNFQMQFTIEQVREMVFYEYAPADAIIQEYTND
jgi:hypothetical protein